MNDFTASNGGTVETTDSGRMIVTDLTPFDYSTGVTRTGQSSYLDPGQIATLREFFQAEADKRLGRWRWPENPDYVVYPDRLNTTPPRGAIRVWNEKTGVSRYYLDRGGVDGIGGQFDPAAAAYFDAHPESKPWHDAAAGEVWILTIDREADVPAVASCSEGGHVIFTAATGGAGGTEEVSPAAAYITAGRRIYPEMSS